MSHSEDGLYKTPKGKERGWFDTFVFPTPDILSYTQGIYIVALMAAEKLGLELQKGELTQAIRKYQGLALSLGRLPLSANIDYKDTSSLIGEFLANRLFEESILDPKTSYATVETLNPGGGGYKIVTKADGSFLDLAEFNRPYEPGDYQNGANWMLFSVAARDVGENNALPYDQRFWETASYYLYVTHNAEYGRTGSRAISWNRSRENHAWNALAHVIIKEVLDRNKKEEILV